MLTSLSLRTAPLPALEDKAGARSLWRRWTLWCGLGELAGFGAAGLVALLLLRLVGEPQTGTERLLTWLAMVADGVAEGSALAATQWHVLRERFPHLTLRAWARPTVGAAALGWGLGMLPSLLMAPAGAAATPQASASPPLLLAALAVAAGGAAAGALFGALQGLVLDRHARRPVRCWVGANALGWSVGMLWLFLGASLPGPHTPAVFVVLSALGFGALGGLSVGAITGRTLVHVKPRRRLR